MRTNSANLRVWWSGGILPPDVFVGETVHFIGKLVTYDEGRVFRVSDALPFKGPFWKVVDPIYQYLFHFTRDPREWCPPEIIERQKWANN